MFCESDAYWEQFCTEKSKFTRLVSFTVIFWYRISLRNAKNEDLKELSHQKRLLFGISETQTLVFSLQV